MMICKCKIQFVKINCIVRLLFKYRQVKVKRKFDYLNIQKICNLDLQIDVNYGKIANVINKRARGGAINAKH